MTIREYRRDKGRSQDREARLLREYQLPADDEHHPMLRRYLLECIRWLAKSFPRYARIVNLRYQGYDTDEICHRMSISPKQYYVYVGRGRSLLRDCLTRKGVQQ